MNLYKMLFILNMCFYYNEHLVVFFCCFCICFSTCSPREKRFTLILHPSRHLIFQTTPSLRRATVLCDVNAVFIRHFNPRPPHGERLQNCLKKISFLAKSHKIAQKNTKLLHVRLSKVNSSLLFM